MLLGSGCVAAQAQTGLVFTRFASHAVAALVCAGACVLDADAINVLNIKDDAEVFRVRNAPTLMTPHLGEFARFTGIPYEEVQKAPYHHLRETIERISVVSAWEESDYFSLKERACLSLVEAITLVSYDQVSDTVYENAKEVLTKEELVSVEWLAILINSWNRLAISSRYIVKG